MTRYGFPAPCYPRAANNRRGIARQIIGENGIANFISLCQMLRKDYPLLWGSTKRNRRIEFYYWIGQW